MENKKINVIQKLSNKVDKNTKILIFVGVALILIAIFSVSLTPVTLQNDTYYTIKIGEHITQSGIDMKDPFSWHENLNYTYPHWLYDLITYFIYTNFGMTGIYFTTCMLSAILGMSIYFVGSKLTKSKAVSFVISLGVMYLIRAYIAARAQLVTFILFTWTIYFIEQFLSTKKKRYAVGLIIIPILIANLHTAVFPFYFVLYLPYIAEYLLAIFADTIIYRKLKVKYMELKIKILSKKSNNPKTLEKVTKTRTKLENLKAKIGRIKVKRNEELKKPYKVKFVKNDNVKYLIIVMIICIFTGFLTPLGTTPYTYLIKTMDGNTTQNINEHQPMTITNENEVLCTVVVFLAILIFTKAKIRLCDLFMICGLCYLMLSSKRQVTMFAIIGSYVLIKLLLQLDYKKIMKKEKNIINNLVTVILMIVLVSGLSYYFEKDKLDDEYVDNSSYPVAACDYILDNIDLSTARFYNEYNYGSYMLFRGIPVFIDSRADLYDPQFSGLEDDIFMDFINTSSIGTFYEDTFNKYDITHVITYKNSKMNMIINKTNDSHYKELYKDDNFVVYERVI